MLFFKIYQADSLYIEGIKTWEEEKGNPIPIIKPLRK